MHGVGTLWLKFSSTKAYHLWQHLFPSQTLCFSDSVCKYKISTYRRRRSRNNLLFGDLTVDLKKRLCLYRTRSVIFK
ncbi:hypothetical protein NQ314_005574 [Rhamnusium bicolor]|uniref:Uncharacterized protein n=1 Tax=Rhamnusium bicolor TaxID=1586634 RepID=A0AAV8ZJ38_9CUCU|nr:hypothetical protein NQ314_005574 [Rhamnusium bicolor]